MNDNVFNLDAHRRKKVKRPISPSALPEVILGAERAVVIDRETWSKDITLNDEPSLTVRTTAVNVLTSFRVHPVSRIVGRQHVKIELRLDLLADEQLKEDDFIERSAELIGRLLGRQVKVLPKIDSATIWLVYTLIGPSATPPR